MRGLVVDPMSTNIIAFVRQTVRRNTGKILKVKGQQEMDNR